ncbi:unnamed protein product [Periconia digitata]|uniref:Uncharacterized protein n=1 Tax=Periconia digitata TaxID=1303443 RepID=A0A9W4XQE1_9PLEO|nr:unnamed protein product [Periconia digitata]
MPMYITPDTATTTRKDFTEFYTNWPLPTTATDQYKRLFQSHQQMMKLLCDHPAMDQNRQQTYSTPANSKNKVYFMWDFVGRTFAILSNAQNVDPADPKGKEWVDCIGRGCLAHTLILDTSGKLEQGNLNAGYSDDAGVEFSEEIKALAPKLSGEA